MKEQIPELTIVVPARNEEKYIGNLLNSLASQDYPSISSIPVYVADYQSTDRTLEVVYSKNHLHTLIIDGGKPSVGRNNGAALAKSRYVLFIDSDVELPDKTFLRRAIEFADEKDLWCVAARVKASNGNFIDKMMFVLNNTAMSLSRITKPYGTGMFLLFDRETFDRLGGFDIGVNYGEDVFLVQHVPKKRFGIVPGNGHGSGYISTSNRRFRKMSHKHILWLAIQTVINQVIGRKSFFYKDHHYFD